MPTRRSVKDRLCSRLLKTAILANQRLNRYRDVVWLIGDGRSGTTWVSELLNSDRRARDMFEPFHPQSVEQMSFLALHQYVRPDAPCESLRAVAADVFSGRFTHHRVDSANRSLLYRGLLIKDIFANLFAIWVSRNFPHVKIVLLLRNPFAVALSKQKLKDWFWVTDPLDLLNQPQLYNDHLKPFESLIRRTSATGDYVLRQVLIWSIINAIPLQQFQGQNVFVSFYENIRQDPSYEMSRIREFVASDTSVETVKLADTITDRPSRVSVSGSGEWRRKSTTDWRDELSPTCIESGLSILEAFGLDRIYDENGLPNENGLGAYSGVSPEACLRPTIGIS